MKINFGTSVTVIQANNSSLPIPILFGPTLMKALQTFFLRENLVNIIVWNMGELYTKILARYSK